MLKGLSPHLSPDLLKTLAEMGHGDEIILADAHFPGHTYGRRVLRADGVSISTLLDAIIPVFELDSYAPPLVMMQVVPGDTLDPQVEIDYLRAIRRHAPQAHAPERIDRFAFYDRAREVYAVLITGEARKYGNILLKKGVTPSSSAPTT
jgi:L-fucose mutarotase